MRLAFTVHKFPPESLGGTEIYAWGLARSLAAAGHDVHVFYPYAAPYAAPYADLTPAERRIDRDGIHLWRAARPPIETEGPAQQYWHSFRNAGIEVEFTEFLSTVQPDLVHFQHVQQVSARLIALAQGLPRVATLHDYWYFCANGQLVRPDHQICPGPHGGWNCVICATAKANLSSLRAAWPLVAMPFAYRNRYLRRMLVQVDQFIAPSELLRQRYAQEGFPAERIAVLENGVDPQRLADATGEHDLPPVPGRPHFGFIGSLAWQKGAHILVDAFNRLPASCALTVYGDESVFPDYVRELKQSARHPNIRFAGRLEFRNVGAALRQFDCLVVPSLWYENSPLVIQEAYAAGVPVIASRLGALIEKVQDNQTGQLFAPGDSADLARVLQAIADRPDLLTEWRSHIRPPITIQEHTRHIEAIYADLLSARSRRPVSPPDHP